MHKTKILVFNMIHNYMKLVLHCDLLICERGVYPFETLMLPKRGCSQTQSQLEWSTVKDDLLVFYHNT